MKTNYTVYIKQDLASLLDLQEGIYGIVCSKYTVGLPHGNAITGFRASLVNLDFYDHIRTDSLTSVPATMWKTMTIDPSIYMQIWSELAEEDDIFCKKVLSGDQPVMLCPGIGHGYKMSYVSAIYKLLSDNGFIKKIVAEKQFASVSDQGKNWYYVYAVGPTLEGIL